MDSERAQNMLKILIKDSPKPITKLLTLPETEAKIKKHDSRLHDHPFSYVVSDTIKRDGIDIPVFRLYVRAKYRSDDGVGWILNWCCDSCLICSNKFNEKLILHHCKLPLPLITVKTLCANVFKII